MGLSPRISLTQNIPFQQLAQVTSLSGTATGTLGLSSSLFLQRLLVPGMMVLSEIDLALGIAFPGTSMGAGGLSRSFVIYSFANSTLLASLTSTSGTSSWTTGPNTAGSASFATQFQGGWAGSVIAAFTLATAATLAPGEYVFGNMLEFKQLTSGWTVSLFGASAAALTSSAGAFLSSAGLVPGTVFGTNATSSAAITAFLTNPGSNISAVTVLSNMGLSAATAFTTTPSAVNVLAAGNTITKIIGEAGAAFTTTLSLGSQVVSFVTQTVLSSNSAGMAIVTGNTGAGSFFAASLGTAAATVISNSGTATFGFLSAAGLTAGSVFTSASVSSAVTSVGLSSLPNFAYFGNVTGSISTFPSAFVAGVYVTASPPASLSLTTPSGLSYNWSSFVQPWFCLVGE